MARYTLYVDKAGKPAFVQMEDELPILGPEWEVRSLDIELPEMGAIDATV